jgi:signal transduction histidine kinase/DNA-binding response OmpR family regulator
MPEERSDEAFSRTSNAFMRLTSRNGELLLKKFNLLYVIVFFSVLLLLQNIVILRSVHEMDGDARVVNYSGLVRGATQRLVKLEISHRENDELINRLQGYLYGLAGYENSYNIVKMDDEDFQKSISDLLVIWDELKDAIYGYRNGSVTADTLLDVSERHFTKADEATGNAEKGSTEKLNYTVNLIKIGIFALIIIVAAGTSFLYRLRRSERRRLEQLNEKNRQLEAAILTANEANRAKSQFLSNMSHDIRTPLNGIIGMTAIASGNPGNPERTADCLRKIDHASRHLQSLVNDVLDMSKIESGKFFLNNAEIYLPEFIEGLINIISQQVKAKKQRLDAALFSVSHERIQGDQLRLNQLFVNILSNAVKFTPVEGSVGLQLRELESLKEGHARYEFIVSDTGIGMSQEFLTKLFDSFSREADSRIDKIEGSGLGLSIAKRIVEMMGGDIRVESEKNNGTRFTVTLEFPLSSGDGPVWDDETLKDKRVLVVDDDETVCASVKGELDSLGVTAVTMTSGRGALAALKGGEVFDAVIIDWKMPEMDGAVLCRLIRGEVSKTLPILISSAYDLTEIEPEAIGAGANGFVPKPLFRSILFAKLNQVLSSDSRDSAVLPLRGGLRLDGVRVLMAEDNELNTEIAAEILTSAGVILDCAVNGREAVDIFSKAEPFTYEIILMDMQMPVMTGCQAATAIRKLDKPDAADVPIIALTANAFEEDIREALDAGMNAHVAKPINFETLKAVISKHLRRADARAASGD